METPIKYKLYYGDMPDFMIDFHIQRGDWLIKHTHTYWEVMLAIDKSCISVVNDKEYLLSKNDIMILRPDDTHVIKKYNNLTHVNVNMEIRCEFLKGYLELIEPRLYERLLCLEEPLIFGVTEESARVYNEYLFKAQSKPFAYSEGRQTVLKQAMARIFLDALQNENIGINKNLLSDRIIESMKKDESISLGLDEICRKNNYNKEYVIRYFKKNGLDTPNNIFRGIKLDFSCGLLDSTTLTIVRIAERVGFGSVGYFNKIFMEKYGMSPGEYRRIHRHRNNSNKAE